MKETRLRSIIRRSLMEAVGNDSILTSINKRGAQGMDTYGSESKDTKLSHLSGDKFLACAVVAASVLRDDASYQSCAELAMNLLRSNGNEPIMKFLSDNANNSRLIGIMYRKAESAGLFRNYRSVRY